MSQNRQPAGIPVGGQFAAQTRQRSSLALDDAPTPEASAMPQPDFTVAGNGTYARPGGGQKSRLAAALAQDDAKHFPVTGASYAGLNTRFGMHFKRTLPELREMAAARGIEPLGDTEVFGPAPVEAIAPELRTQMAEHSFGAALNNESYATTDSDDGQRSYRWGMAYADACGVASFLNPHDLMARNDINMSVQQAASRGLTNTEHGRAAFFKDVSDLCSNAPVTEADREAQVRELVTAALTAHEQAGSGQVETKHLSPHQWNNIGMRYGFADAAARWTTANDHHHRAESIRRAIDDGITDVDTLTEVAYGRLDRDRYGNWVDPYTYLDDKD